MLKKILLFLIFCLFFISLKAQTFNHQINNGKELPKNLLVKTDFNFSGTLDKALSYLEEKHKIIFNYNKSDLSLQKVNFSVSNEILFKIIVKLLQKHNLELTITENNSLVISENHNRFNLIGKVISALDKSPLYGVSITISERFYGTSTNFYGGFYINNLPTGFYSIKFNYLGFEEFELKDVLVDSKNNNFYEIHLRPRELKLEEIIVTPGHYTIKGKQAYSSQVLLKKDIQNFNIGEDIYRAVNQLPGVTANDYSAKFNIRGGESDEVLVLFDGLELYEPFHLKDFIGGIMSIIDLDIIGNVNLLTGGYPVKYGNRMSGVFNINSLDPQFGKNKVTASLSIMNAKISSTGSFNENKGSWLFSARKGYIDILADMLNENDFPSINYYDFYGNLKYQISKNHKVSFNILYSRDDLDYIKEGKDSDELKTGYSSKYFWLNLNSILNNKINFETVISFGSVSSDRKANIYNLGYNEYTADLTDNRKFEYVGIKQDWTFDLDDFFQLMAGFDLNYSNANYNYDSYNKIYYYDQELKQKYIEEKNIVDLKPNGGRYGIYVSGKFKFLEKLTAETGLRYDIINYSKEYLLSPRINFAYEINRKSFLRAGFGYYYQPNLIHEIDIQDKEHDFYKSQQAIHYLLGFEHRFDSHWFFKLDAYIKKLNSVNPIFRNFSNTLPLVPELEYDRIKMHIKESEMKGVELYLKYKSDQFNGSISYTLSSSSDKIDYIEALLFNQTPENKFYPRPYDQRHTFYLDLNFRPSENWNINLSWNFHSGWPYTSKRLIKVVNSENKKMYSLIFNNYHNKRFKSYHRMDLRTTYLIKTSYGKVKLLLELINLYDQQNDRNAYYSGYTNSYNEYNVTEKFDYWFPFIPSFGISWTYEL